jgi:transcription elongation factor Elf1
LLESDQEFNCPYCGEVIAVRVDRTGGSRQTFVTDCEVCCRPILVEADIDADGYVNFIAKREGEG